MWNGVVYIEIQPSGTALTESQARTLDDEFFLARPLQYFNARISELLHAAGEPETRTNAAVSEFALAAGLNPSDTLLQFTEDEQRLQLAVDALSLRHHAAESLTRFLYAAVAAQPKPGDARCTWLAVEQSPISIIQVVDATVAALGDDNDKFLRALYAPGTVLTQEKCDYANSAVEWLNHASRLLTGNELSVNAGHNKVKHGLALSTSGDIRIDFIEADRISNGEIPLSAFASGKSAPLFDRPFLTYLNRPHPAKTSGLELTSLRVDLPVVLAEAWMMANIFSSLFNAAAVRHFGDHQPKDLAPRPPAVALRSPTDVVGGAVLGYRQPVTDPLKGGTARDAGLFFHGSFMPVQLDYGSRSSAVITEG